MTSRDEDLPLLPWGGHEFRPNELEPHSFLVGATKSGKTILLRGLMRAALLDWSDTLRCRALVYDGKRELYPLLCGMGVSERDILVMTPTDRRSRPWDIAADVETFDDAVMIAKMLAPDGVDRGGSEEFFVKASQAITAGVIWVLHREFPRRWDLYDVIEALRLPSRIERVLSRDPRCLALYRTYVHEDKQAAGILATLNNLVVIPYGTTAMLWKRSRSPKVSLKWWAQTAQSGVLLLMPDPTAATVEPLNQAIFRYAAKLLDARPEIDVAGLRHESWLFLDEFRFAGPLPLLEHTLGKGRSRGVFVALAAQTIEGIVDVYGEHKTYDMLANAANLAVLRLARSPSAEKVASLFGKYEVWEEDHSESSTKNYRAGLFNWWHDSISKTTSTSRKRVVKDLVLPGELTDLPPAGEAHGVSGFFSTPLIGTWRGPVPWSFVERHLRPAAPHVEAFERRDPADFHHEEFYSVVSQLLASMEDEQDKSSGNGKADPDPPLRPKGRGTGAKK